MNHEKKACEQCRSDRVAIGEGFKQTPIWKRFIGVVCIYIPIFVTIPFVIVGALLSYYHLKFLGAQNLKKYSDFVPGWDSHRYKTLQDQATMEPISYAPWLGWKWFWIFNCKMYCPLSVALFEWTAYLVKMVENWWCPFFHETKASYSNASIDKSYWHVEGEAHKLHPDDQTCSIWYEEEKPDTKP